MLSLHIPGFGNIFKRMTVSEGCAFGPSYHETHTVMTGDLQDEWHILIRTIKHLSLHIQRSAHFYEFSEATQIYTTWRLGTYAVVQSQEREQDPVAQEFLQLSVHAPGFTSRHFVLRPSKLSFQHHQTLLVLPLQHNTFHIL